MGDLGAGRGAGGREKGRGLGRGGLKGKEEVSGILGCERVEGEVKSTS